MENSATVLLVGKHKLLCECLAAELDQLTQFRIAGPCGDLREAGGRIRACTPDILLVDAGLPDELDLEQIREIARDFQQIRIVIFGIPTIETVILRCFEAGVQGCVAKGASLAQLREILGKVFVGDPGCPPEIMNLLLSRLSELAINKYSREQIEAFDLTPRELEILERIADGLSNQQIADLLCLSLFTVKNHVHHILAKLEVKNRQAAVERAYENGWLQDQRSHRRQSSLACVLPPP